MTATFELRMRFSDVKVAFHAAPSSLPAGGGKEGERGELSQARNSELRSSGMTTVGQW